jgi:undecaprenyl-diphosphatase
VVVGFLPAAVIGILLNKAIKAHLFGMWPVIAAWLVGGVVILVFFRLRKANAEYRGKGRSLGEIGVGMALIIGFMQCIAMWPGVSRSLATILGGLMVGLSMSAAVEFSFLLGLLTLGAATSYDALKHGQLMLHTFDHVSLAIGLVTAFVFAVISVKWMVSYLNRRGMEVFGYYRIIVAVAGAAMLFAGIL